MKTDNFDLVNCLPIPVDVSVGALERAVANVAALTGFTTPLAKEIVLSVLNTLGIESRRGQQEHSES